MLRVQVADTGERLDTMEVLVLQSVITTRSQLYRLISEPLVGGGAAPVL